MAIKKVFASLLLGLLNLVCFSTAQAFDNELTLTPKSDINAIDLSQTHSFDTGLYSESSLPNNYFSQYNEAELEISTTEPSQLQVQIFKLRNWLILRAIRIALTTNNGYEYVKQNSARVAAFVKMQIKKILGLRSNHGKTS